MSLAEAMKRAILAIEKDSLSGKSSSFPGAVLDGARATAKQKQAAINKYANDCRPEDILVITDTAVFSSCKTGMIVTEDRFYCDEFKFGAFGSGKIPVPVYLKELKQVKIVDNGDWLELVYQDGSAQKAYSGIYTQYYLAVFRAIFGVYDSYARASSGETRSESAGVDSKLDAFVKQLKPEREETVEESAEDKLRRQVQQMLDDQSQWKL